MPVGVGVVERETRARAGDATASRLRVVVRGAVQGVGFRPFVYRLATSLGLRGWVGGGKLMHQLIERVFVGAFGNPLLDARHDGATFQVGGAGLAFTTDSYVVRPLFFPGGDIGTLAVNGTVNDLAVCGARPLYLSAGFIIEGGLPTETLWRVVQSMKRAAEEAGVEIVTGDTKVVDRGEGDGVFVNTAGVGRIEHGLAIAPRSVRPGDAILLSGDLGRHGIAIMAERAGLKFESAIESDCAPAADLVLRLIDGGVDVHCLRDLTRGGLTSAFVEISEASGTHVEIAEAAVPVREDVRAGPRAVLLVGVTPESTSTGVGLSARARAPIDPAVKEVLAELKRLGCEAEPRASPRRPQVWWEEAAQAV